MVYNDDLRGADLPFEIRGLSASPLTGNTSPWGPLLRTALGTNIPAASKSPILWWRKLSACRVETSKEPSASGRLDRHQLVSELVGLPWAPGLGPRSCTG